MENIKKFGVDFRREKDHGYSLQLEGRDLKKDFETRFGAQSFLTSLKFSETNLTNF